MDMTGITTHVGGVAGNDGALPCVARSVRILLVAHYTTFLMSLASHFERQLYKVTTTESAKIALALFRERKNYYDIIIADICIPEMQISEFVGKLHAQRRTIPIILIAEESTMNLARETIGNGVCYVFPKPPRQCDISNVWQHIPRVTGEMPVLSDMTNFMEGCSSGAAGSQKMINLNMKFDNTDREGVKRKINQIVDNPNSSNDAPEEDGHNLKKPRLRWTSYLDDKFVQAINILGGEHEEGARPKAILKLMNEPGLKPRHIASHLLKYRRQRRKSVCGIGNAGNIGKNDNLGEGTSGSNQQFDGMTSNDDINQFLQNLETSEGGASCDWFN